jgi:hypothetical protein
MSCDAVIPASLADPGTAVLRLTSQLRVLWRARSTSAVRHDIAR